MEKLWMCRICLIEDVQMHLISETQLQTIYEALTCRPVCTLIINSVLTLDHTHTTRYFLQLCL